MKSWFCILWMILFVSGCQAIATDEPFELDGKNAAMDFPIGDYLVTAQSGPKSSELMFVKFTPASQTVQTRQGEAPAVSFQIGQAPDAIGARGRFLVSNLKKGESTFILSVDGNSFESRSGLLGRYEPDGTKANPVLVLKMDGSGFSGHFIATKKYKEVAGSVIAPKGETKGYYNAVVADKDLKTALMTLPLAELLSEPSSLTLKPFSRTTTAERKTLEAQRAKLSSKPATADHKADAYRQMLFEAQRAVDSRMATPLQAYFAGVKTIVECDGRMTGGVIPGKDTEGRSFWEMAIVIFDDYNNERGIPEAVIGCGNRLTALPETLTNTQTGGVAALKPKDMGTYRLVVMDRNYQKILDTGIQPIE